MDQTTRVLLCSQLILVHYSSNLTLMSLRCVILWEVKPKSTSLVSKLTIGSLNLLCEFLLDIYCIHCHIHCSQALLTTHWVIFNLIYAHSALKSIQLLVVVKHKLVEEYGMNKILGPIVEDVLKLEKVRKIKLYPFLFLP